MRSWCFKIPAIARAAGYAAVAASIAAAAVHFRHDRIDATNILWGPSMQRDPLAPELARCQTIGMAAQNDAACQAAWAESRRRFFTYRPSDYTAIAQPNDNNPAARPKGQ
jgi:conjugative transfer region protein TrbK